jgi:hypothetical protein
MFCGGRSARLRRRYEVTDSKSPSTRLERDRGRRLPRLRISSALYGGDPERLVSYQSAEHASRSRRRNDRSRSGISNSTGRAMARISDRDPLPQVGTDASRNRGKDSATLFWRQHATIRLGSGSTHYGTVSPSTAVLVPPPCCENRGRIAIF